MNEFIGLTLLIVGLMSVAFLLAVLFYGLRDSRGCSGNCKQGRHPCDCKKQ